MSRSSLFIKGGGVIFDENELFLAACSDSPFFVPNRLDALDAPYQDQDQNHCFFFEKSINISDHPL